MTSPLPHSASPRPRRIGVARVLAWVVLAGLGTALVGSQITWVEEPAYAVVTRQGALEIRDYRPVIAAEVTVTGDQRAAASKGFRLLAGYIFGANRGHQSIAMTAPVAQAPKGQTIAMTAPVTQTPASAGWVVRFTMPARYSLATLPVPDDPRVTLRPVPATRLAVIRFSGLVGAAQVAEKTAQLLAFVKAQHLHAAGPVALAQYNPPWTLWFLRRNELMVAVAQELGEGVQNR